MDRNDLRPDVALNSRRHLCAKTAANPFAETKSISSAAVTCEEKGNAALTLITVIALARPAFSLD